MRSAIDSFPFAPTLQLHSRPVHSLAHMADKTSGPQRSMPRRARRLPVGTGPGYERATDAWREVRPSLGRFIAHVEWTGMGMLVWVGVSRPAIGALSRSPATASATTVFSDVNPVLPR